MKKVTKDEIMNSAEFQAFCEVVRYCAAESELVREFNRLTGHHMGEHRTPIEIAIDNACKHDPDAEAMPDFLSFVWDYVFKPLCCGKAG